jgi:hypothetical protein
MKKLLLLTVLGSLLGAATGCRFMECLWRGGPANQTCQQAAPVTYGSPCATPCAPSTCDPCGVPATTTTTPTPGPATYAPGPSR